MPGFIFVNGCRGAINVPGVAAAATSIPLVGAAAFPASIPSGYVLVLTMYEQGLPGVFEIVHCTGISGTTLTVERAQEDTTALDWPAGTVIEAAMTAGIMQSLGGVATGETDGLMSAEDKAKLDGIAAEANKYVHPSTHPASMIEQDDDLQFVAAVQKAFWDAKASTDVATADDDGLMSAEDKAKLDDIEAEANNYAHPTTDGNKHVPATGTTNAKKFLKAGATAGSAEWSDELDGILCDVQDKVQALGPVSGSVSINFAQGNVVTMTISGATTLSFSGATSGLSRTVLLRITNGGTNITWPAGGSVPPLTASGLDLVTINTVDGFTSWVSSTRLDA